MTKLRLFLIFYFVTLLLFGQEKVFVREYTYKAGEMDSKISCRAIATNEIRALLLNEIGVYVESEQLLKSVETNNNFSQSFVENISTLSAGITKLQILDEKWSGDIFWMKAAISIDEESFKEMLETLVSDKKKSKELYKVKNELQELKIELSKIRSESKKSQNDFSHEYSKKANELNWAEHYYNASIDFKNKNYVSAIANYTKAIDLNPEEPLVYFGRAVSKRTLNDLRGAISDYSIAIKLDPTDGYKYLARGLAQMGLKRDKDALKDFNKAIERVETLEPTEKASAYGIRGVVKIQMGDKLGACKDWSRAGELGDKAVYQFIEKNCQ